MLANAVIKGQISYIQPLICHWSKGNLIHFLALPRREATRLPHPRPNIKDSKSKSIQKYLNWKKKSVYSWRKAIKHISIPSFDSKSSYSTTWDCALWNRNKWNLVPSLLKNVAIPDGGERGFSWPVCELGWPDPKHWTREGKHFASICLCFWRFLSAWTKMLERWKDLWDSSHISILRTWRLR